jgi:hypothetical protein
MKKFILFLFIFSSNSFLFSQTTTNLRLNKKLIPQEIEYDGKPELSYMVNDKIIALDYYSETDNDGSYIRMKISNREVLLKMQKNKSSKTKRIYSNNEYMVVFYDIIYGSCAGEGSQNLIGKILIQSKLEQNTINFKGADALYSSKKCQGIGNG